VDDPAEDDEPQIAFYCLSWYGVSAVARKLTLKSGETRYEARWCDESGEHRRRFRLKRDAEAAEQKGRDSRQRRKAGLPPERENITYEELVRRFLSQYDGRSIKWKREMLAYSVARFGSVPVRDLLPDRLSGWLHSLPLAPKTKKHILDSMRQVLSAGVEWDYLAKNPARASAVKTPRQVNGDIRPFESWSEVSLVATAAGRYGPLVRFVCATGLRPEKWIPLRWSDVDIVDRVAVVNKVCLDGVIYEDQGKTDAAFRRVQLQERALAALGCLPSPLSTEQLIFPSPTGTLINLGNWRRRVWRRALDTAGVEQRRSTKCVTRSRH
jgi:integrase